MNIQNLSFDSEIFNYPVGKATIEEGWNEKDFPALAKDYQLVYLFSTKALDFSDPAIQLVDTKITFQKSLGPNDRIGEIQNYGQTELLDEVIELAYLSGVYSRFKTDPRLQNQEFEKLYKLWITKAFEKKQILTAPGNAGMTTCSVEKELGKIGLIAVSELHQGKGWGRKLVKAAEYTCRQEGAKEMQIPTQLHNAPACKLYESLGYKPAGQVFVYHWWRS